MATFDGGHAPPGMRNGFNRGFELMEGNTEIQDNIARSRLQILYNLTCIPDAGNHTEHMDWLSA